MKIPRWYAVLVVLLTLLLSVCGSLPGALPTARPTQPDSPPASTPRPTATPVPENGGYQLGEPEYLLTVRDSGQYEPKIEAGDFNGDGLEDLVVTRLRFQTHETFEIDILLNDGSGGLYLATSDIFNGDPPVVQNPRQVIIADFNGDGVDDVFIADHGYDANPFPGYQNALALSAPGGKIVDATANLPPRSDFTHSAAAADVDGDGDLDLFIGNTWGQNQIDPYLLLNNGAGAFALSPHPLPPQLRLGENGYTTCAFADVNGDGSPDLILGDAGDDIGNEYSTRVSLLLLNDGSGRFALLPDALPPKSNSPFDIGHVIQPLDLDGDSHVDLVMVYERPNSGGSYMQALINNGDGTFYEDSQRSQDLAIRMVWIHRLDLRDIDDDGDLDLIARPWDDRNPSPLLFLNDGAGRFSQVPFAQGLPHLYYDFLDLDGDGGHDLLFATYAPPEDIYVMRDQAP